MPYNFDAPIEVRDQRNGSWFWIHKDVWNDIRLTSSDKALYGTLAFFSNNNSQASYPSFIKLAEFSGLSQRQVALSVKKLVDLKYVSKEGSPKTGKPNVYILLKTGYAKSAHPTEGMQNSTGRYAKSAQEGMQNSTTNNNNKQELLNNSVTFPNGKSRCPLLLKENFPDLVAKYPNGHKECTEYIDAVGVEKGHKFINYPKQIGVVHKMLRAGFDFEDMDGAIDRMNKDNFWQEKGWDFGNVATILERQ